MSIACICCGDAIKPPENCTSFHYFRVCRPWKIIDEGKNACLVVRFFEKAVPLPLSPMPLRSAAAPRPPDIPPCSLSSVEADCAFPARPSRLPAVPRPLAAAMPSDFASCPLPFANAPRALPPLMPLRPAAPPRPPAI